jgi:hypothetical protein
MYKLLNSCNSEGLKVKWYEPDKKVGCRSHILSAVMNMWNRYNIKELPSLSLLLFYFYLWLIHTQIFELCHIFADYNSTWAVMSYLQSFSWANDRWKKCLSLTNRSLICISYGNETLCIHILSWLNWFPGILYGILWLCSLETVAALLNVLLDYKNWAGCLNHLYMRGRNVWEHAPHWTTYIWEDKMYENCLLAPPLLMQCLWNVQSFIISFSQKALLSVVACGIGPEP